MKRLVSLLAAPLCGTCIGLAALPPVQACSDIILDTSKTLNNQVVSARTMDFPGMDHWKNQLSRVTRGVIWRSFAYDSLSPGVEWTIQYGFIGLDFLVQETTLLLHQRIYSDGMNEEGLSAGLLWLETGQFTDRVANNRTPQPGDLHYVDLVAWVLGQFKTVSEVKTALENVAPSIFGTNITAGWIPAVAVPLHLVVHDRSGASLIAEWYPTAGGGEPIMHLYVGDAVDKVGVLTNAPVYVDQVKALDNFTGIKNQESSPGAGDGAMFGTPGGFDSPSRFVRLFKIRQFLDEANTNDRYRNVGAVPQALHAINNVDLGHGVDADPLEPSLPALGWYQETGVTLVRDHTNRVLYFKGLHYQTLQRIELAKVDFTGLAGGGMIGPSIPADVEPAKSARYEQGVDVSAKLTAPRVIYPQAQYMSTAANISVTVKVAAADQRKTGNYYIYAVDLQKRYWNWTGAKYGWKQVPRGSLLPAASASLATRTFDNVFVNQNFGDIKGWRVFAGYGTSPADMLLGGNAQEVYVIEDEPGYVEPVALQKFR